MRFATCLIVSVPLFTINIAIAQEFPSKIQQPNLDPSGVEVKSGRFGGISITAITIGGVGSSALQRIYAPQDGRELLVSGIFDVHSSQQFFDRVNLYDVIRYQHPNGTVRFRRRGTSGAFESERPALGVLIDGWMIDKYGVKYGDGKAVYPDGREVWGATYSEGVSPNFQNLSVVMNNYGFLLKTHQGVTQAVNLARDYCDVIAESLCGNLKEDRRSTFLYQSGTYSLTNAAGERVNVLMQPIEAYVEEPICQYYSGPRTCTGVKYTYNYPSTISFPGTNKSNINISYDKIGDLQTVSHSEIVVKQISSSYSTTNYENTVYPYGGGGNGPTGFQVNIKSYIDNILRFNTNSTNIGTQWPSSILTLNSLENAIKRNTSYGYDSSGNLKTVTNPNGSQIVYEYDDRFNITKISQIPVTGSGASPLIARYEYMASCSIETQAKCNLPVAAISANGDKTEFEYNDRGQLTVRREPVASGSSRRTITEYKYTMRTAYVLSSSGAPMPAGGPISLLDKTVVCKEAYSCGNSLDNIITEYDYGPVTGLNNLLLRSVVEIAKGVTGSLESHRKCYYYNYFGEKINEVNGNANLQTC